MKHSSAHGKNRRWYKVVASICATAGVDISCVKPLSTHHIYRHEPLEDNLSMLMKIHLNLKLEIFLKCYHVRVATTWCDACSGRWNRIRQWYDLRGNDVLCCELSNFGSIARKDWVPKTQPRICCYDTEVCTSKCQASARTGSIQIPALTTNLLPSIILVWRKATFLRLFHLANVDFSSAGIVDKMDRILLNENKRPLHKVKSRKLLELAGSESHFKSVPSIQAEIEDIASASNSKTYSLQRTSREHEGDIHVQ